MTDYRTNQIYLKTVYECGCVVTTCPPPPACPNHIGKKIKRVHEEKRESEGKELKLGRQDALDHDQQVAQSQIAEAEALAEGPEEVPGHFEISDEKRAREQEEKERLQRETEEDADKPEIKELSVGVEDDLGEHWADEVN